MPDHQYALLSAALSPVVHLSMDQGWEEITDASVTFLLRTMLGRGPRDAVSVPELTVPSDTNKLKKHLGLLLDKVTKGRVQLSLDTPAPPNTTDTREETVYKDEDDLVDPPALTAEDTTEVPLGSRLGEDRARSARVRSARLMSARKIPERMPGDDRISGNYRIPGDDCIPEDDHVPGDDHIPEGDHIPEDDHIPGDDRIPGDGESSIIMDNPQATSMASQDQLTDSNIDTDTTSLTKAGAFAHQSSFGSILEDPILEESDMPSDSQNPAVEEDEQTKTPEAEEPSMKPAETVSETLKITKVPLKENTIESPADIFTVEDNDDIW
ncbi:uncharacterized protein [Cherax quadricarinatus]